MYFSLVSSGLPCLKKHTKCAMYEIDAKDSGNVSPSYDAPEPNFSGRAI